MSLRSGAPTRGPPVHQNSFAFKHNKNSKKTQVIKRIQHSGLCKRCHEQVEWRKKYRKYKPLKAPSHCNACQQKTVKLAYHTICHACAKANSKCAKCAKVLTEEDNAPMEVEGQQDEPRFKMPSAEELEDMSERQRRTALRKAAAASKGTTTTSKAGGGGKDKDEEEDEDDFDEDDDDDDEEEEDL